MSLVGKLGNHRDLTFEVHFENRTFINLLNNLTKGRFNLEKTRYDKSTLNIGDYNDFESSPTKYEQWMGIATDIKAYFAHFKKLLELQRGASKSYYWGTPSLGLIVLHESGNIKEINIDPYVSLQTVVGKALPNLSPLNSYEIILFHIISSMIHDFYVKRGKLNEILEVPYI
jgi:hypothetical protein